MKPAAASRERRLRWTVRLILYPLLLGLVAFAWHQRQASGHPRWTPGPPDVPTITTFDGLTYHAVSLGDFHFVVDDRSGLDIQARMMPIGHVGAVVHRLAMRIEGRLVEYNFGSEKLLIDGRRPHLPNHHWLDLGHGAFVSRVGLTYRIAWPGHRARAEVDLRARNFDISVPRHMHPGGLLGDNDGQRTDDLMLASGRRLAPLLTDRNIRAFTDNWRVGPGESLFQQ